MIISRQSPADRFFLASGGKNFCVPTEKVFPPDADMKVGRGTVKKPTMQNIIKPRFCRYIIIKKCSRTKNLAKANGKNRKRR